jgi:hypothetical protein
LLAQRGALLSGTEVCRHKVGGSDQNMAFFLRKCNVAVNCSDLDVKKVRSELKIPNPGGRKQKD